MHDEMGDCAADLDPHPCIRVGLDTLKFGGLDQAIIGIEASCPTTKGLNRPQGVEGPRRAKVHKPDAAGSVCPDVAISNPAVNVSPIVQDHIVRSIRDDGSMIAHFVNMCTVHHEDPDCYDLVGSLS